MDRGQLLVGMTAAGLAGRLNLDVLWAAQSAQPASKSRGRTRFRTADGEHYEDIRGPVKMCLEETGEQDGKMFTHVREYSPDGKMVSSRMEQDGRLVFSTSDSKYSEERDAAGRLVKSSCCGQQGQPARETYYSYDNAGRMLTVTNNLNSDRTEYHYAADGSKTSVQTFDSKTIEGTRNAAFGVSAWDAATSGFGVPMEGTVRISFDDNDRETEMRILSADGQVVAQIVRKYDAEGRIVEEKPLEQNLALLMAERMPPEQRDSMPPAVVAALNQAMGGKKPSITTYTYDDDGYLLEKRDCNRLVDETTTYRYNDRGDKIEERHTYEENSRMSAGGFSIEADGTLVPRVPAAEVPVRRLFPKETTARSTYQYDSYGNWTERVETRNDGTRRTITYY